MVETFGVSLKISLDVFVVRVLSFASRYSPRKSKAFLFDELYEV